MIHNGFQVRHARRRGRRRGGVRRRRGDLRRGRHRVRVAGRGPEPRRRQLHRHGQGLQPPQHPQEGRHSLRGRRRHQEDHGHGGRRRQGGLRQVRRRRDLRHPARLQDLPQVHRRGRQGAPQGRLHKGGRHRDQAVPPAGHQGPPPRVHQGPVLQVQDRDGPQQGRQRAVLHRVQVRHAQEARRRLRRRQAPIGTSACCRGRTRGTSRSRPRRRPCPWSRGRCTAPGRGRCRGSGPPPGS